MNKLARLTMVIAVGLLAATLSAVRPSTPAAGAAQPTRSLIVVGDSIVLAATEELVASAPGDWSVQVDAEVSRPTNVGHDIVRGNLNAITDTLVIGLGANDAASPEIFRNRAAALLAEVAEVPHVFWIEIAEVRDYYPTANATIRDLAGAYRNVSIVPWTALATGTPGLTASDGLHLTGAGQQALADAILAQVVQTADPQVPAPGLLAEVAVATQDLIPDVPGTPAAPAIEPASLRLLLTPIVALLSRLQALITNTILYR